MIKSLEQEIDVVTLSRLLGHALDDHKRASVEKLGGIYGAGRGYSRLIER